MRLRAWRETWMWLAVSACGAPQWMKKGSSTPVTIFAAPPLAGATYVATVDPGDFGHPGPRVGLEHGAFECQRLVDLSADNADAREEHQQWYEEAQKKCPPELAKSLRERAGFVFVVDRGGPRWLSAQAALAAAQPIDSPAKALLVVWLTGRYGLDWNDGKRGYGGPEDGRVRVVGGGYEVVASTSETTSKCGGPHARETVTNYRHVLFVDHAGAIAERERVVSTRYDVADPCHPLGRRPADFVDVVSGGTLRGQLLRAMHHEAESVRAFERIARELRAHGAPDELWRAALQAADDERDHAKRCARLAGAVPAIDDDNLPVRTLIELAIDNAREGCVGESFAALAAVVQARTASEPALRDHFAAIAVDELAHAALAHAIGDWLDSVLSADELAQMWAAREGAMRELVASVAVAAAPADGALGVPTGEVAARLLAALPG